MPKLVTALLCDDVRQEVNSKYSLMGVFDTFHVKDFSQAVPIFWLVVRIGFDTRGDHSVDMILHDPRGQQIGSDVRGVVRTDERDGATELYVAALFVAVSAQMFAEEGRHRFAIKADGAEVGEAPFVVARAQ